jgi:hypothetical protein
MPGCSPSATRATTAWAPRCSPPTKGRGKPSILDNSIDCGRSSVKPRSLCLTGSLQPLIAQWSDGQSVGSGARAFVDESRKRPMEAARTRESWDGAVPDLVRCPRDGPHPRRGHAGRGRAAHAVCQEAIDAGVFVNTSGLADQPSVVAADGPFPEAIGGVMVVDVPSREEALMWAAKVAGACRCAVQLWEFGFDPEGDAMLRQAKSRQ